METFPVIEVDERMNNFLLVMILRKTDVYKTLYTYLNVLFNLMLFFFYISNFDKIQFSYIYVYILGAIKHIWHCKVHIRFKVSNSLTTQNTTNI